MAVADKTLADLGWPQLCAALAGRAHTAAGARLAAALLPLGEAAAARARIAEVAEARLLHELEEPPPFGGIHDVETAVRRAAKEGLLEPRELITIADTLAAAARLRRHLLGGRESCPRLAARAERLVELAHVEGPIHDAFDEQGRLADHASPALGGLRRRAAQLREELTRTVDHLLDAPEVAAYLQDRFYTQREDRFVLPVRSEDRSRVRGIVHGTSQSGATVFIEPEAVVGLNNALKLAELEVADEEHRILAELSSFVREDADLILQDVAELADLDLIDAAALLAEALAAAAPEVDGGLALEAARHPLMVLAGRECVPNRIEVPPGGALIISGPNAGGKTVALKTAGLLTLMAQAGLHVPAGHGSRVPFFGAVLSDMGDEQSLERNLSTFSAHVLNLVRFLGEAGPGTLVLLDEIAVGTDPAQGAALAEAVLVAFAARGATVLVTTHYDRLKALPARDPRFVNASVGFDLARLAPTYRLHHGVPGGSGALTLARRLGLDPAVVEHAERLQDSREAGLEQLLERLADERQRLERERAEARRERDRQRAAAAEAEARAQALAAREHALRVRAHGEAVATLGRAREELEAARTLLRRGATTARVAQAERMIGRAAETINAEAPAPPVPDGRPARPEDLRVGAAVLVPRLGGRGTVLAAPERGKVGVQIGAVRVQVDVTEVLLPPAAGGRRAAAAGAVTRRAGAAAGGAVTRRAAAAEPGSPGEAGPDAAAPGAPATAAVRQPDNTLDLRGERVDDALRLAEEFIDRALRDDREVVFLVHGHGTGALRAALREHLAAHVAVRTLRPGALEEGGDGVTVVELR